MARRVGYAIGAGLQSAGDTLSKYALTQELRTQQEQQTGVRALETGVLKGDIEPEQADLIAQQHKYKGVQPGYFHTLRPSGNQMLQGEIADMTKAPSRHQVESPLAIEKSPSVSRVRPQMGPAGPMFPSGTPSFDVKSGERFTPTEPGTGEPAPEGTLPSLPMQPINPPQQTKLGVRQQILKQFDPYKQEGIVSPTGETKTKYFGSPQELAGQEFTTKLPAIDEGVLKGKAGLAERLQNELSETRIKAEIDQKIREITETARPKAEAAVLEKKMTAPIETQQAINTAAGIKRAGINIDQQLGTGEFKPSADELKAVGFAGRAADMHEIMSVLEPQLMARGLPANVLDFDVLPSSMKDPLVRQYVQAAMSYIQSPARRQSGGAVTKEEWDLLLGTQAYRPGDDPGTMAQKLLTRRSTISGMAEESGRMGAKRFVTMKEVEDAATRANIKPEAAIKTFRDNGFKVIR